MRAEHVFDRARSVAVNAPRVELRICDYRVDELPGPAHAGEVGIYVRRDKPPVIRWPQKMRRGKLVVSGRARRGVCGTPMTHFIEAAREEKVHSRWQTDLRASENMRRKPRQDASRGLPCIRETAPSHSPWGEKQSSGLLSGRQVHPQTREKDALGDAILIEVKNTGVRLKIGRSHRHQLAPKASSLRANQSAGDESGSNAAP